MKEFFLSLVSIYVTKTNQDIKNYTTPLHSEKRFIKNQSYAIAEERLAFLDGERLGDLSIGIEDNATCRKIRRIMEKRVAQNFWSNASRRRRRGNGARSPAVSQRCSRRPPAPASTGGTSCPVSVPAFCLQHASLPACVPTAAPASTKRHPSGTPNNHSFPKGFVTKTVFT